jgi:acyl-CoA hydrolase
MLKNKKYARESVTTYTQMIMPNDTNPLNGLMGGIMMQWMDIVGAIAAQKHSNCIVVTASVDHISFANTIQIGDVITLKAHVTRAFNTSMEVFIEAFAENIPEAKKVTSNHAFFTFVALDKNRKPVKVPELIPETEEESKLYEGAVQRRKVRLALAKKENL